MFLVLVDKLLAENEDDVIETTISLFGSGDVFLGPAVVVCLTRHLG